MSTGQTYLGGTIESVKPSAASLVPSLVPSLTPAVEAPAASDSRAQPNRWILNPAVDLIFVSGGLFWLLIAYHLFTGAGTVHGVSGVDVGQAPSLAALGVLLLGDTHNAATLLRLYERPEHRTTRGLVAYWLPILLTVLAAVALFNQTVLAYTLQLYVLLIAQHFTAQAYGIALLYAYKRKYQLSGQDKSCLKLALDGAMVAGVVRMLADPAMVGASLFGVRLPLSTSLPPWTMNAAMLVCAATAALFLAKVIARAIETGRPLLPLPALLLVATTIAVFAVGSDLFGTLWLYVPAFFHASQYLVVTLAGHLKDEYLPEGVEPSKIAGKIFSIRGFQYYGVLLVIAGTAYGIVPLTLARTLGVDFVAAFAVVFAAVNLHHFAADAMLWKMRDPKVRQLLVL